ncbi:hypothetical protein [Streptomyces sp. NPDC048361]|uniref:hypothetical protein n=1 Tax=Streptomyces sp. NPDC048361 TaxID=3154720 RepID=UPI003448B0E1
MSAGAERMFWGGVILLVGFGLLTLLAVYWAMPQPHRAHAAPPTDQDGYSYICYCWRDPVRVTFGAAEPERKPRRPTKADRPPHRPRE